MHDAGGVSAEKGAALTPAARPSREEPTTRARGGGVYQLTSACHADEVHAAIWPSVTARRQWLHGLSDSSAVPPWRHGPGRNRPEVRVKKVPRRFGSPGRVYRSSPRRELRCADPGLQSAPKDEGPARRRPLLCLSGYAGLALAYPPRRASLLSVGPQPPPSPPAGGPERTTNGLSLCQGCAGCASVLVCGSAIA
jgi:hypothetical protein